MANLFLLIKRKGSRKFLGAIPAKKGTSKQALRRKARKQVKKGFTFVIVTETQLKKMLQRMALKKGTRKIRRKKVRRKRKRR